MAINSKACHKLMGAIKPYLSFSAIIMTKNACKFEMLIFEMALVI